MQELDQKKRSALIKSITLNAIASLMISAIIWGYIIPTYDEITTKVEALNTLNAAYIKIKNNGVQAAEYQTLISKYANVTKQPGDTADLALINKALKKSNDSMTYLEWVNTELGKQSNLDTEIDTNNRIIGSIIPTYSDATRDVKDVFDKNRISLGQLVRFVENDLLKKNNLESFSPIGFGNLTFDNKGNSLVNIGSYKLSLDLKGSNRNLTNFINQIQSSGNLSLKDGKLVDTTSRTQSLQWAGTGTINGQLAWNAANVDNLLVTIDTIQFTNTLDQSDKENRATVTLVLYVRARSYSDFLKIRSVLGDKIKDLSAQIETVIAICADGSSAECKNENIYTASQSVRTIQDDAAALNKKIQEAIKNSTIRDLNSEFDTLFSTYNSYKALNEILQKNLTIIETIRKANTPSK